MKSVEQGTQQPGSTACFARRIPRGPTLLRTKPARCPSAAGSRRLCLCRTTVQSGRVAASAGEDRSIRTFDDPRHQAMSKGQWLVPSAGRPGDVQPGSVSPSRRASPVCRIAVLQVAEDSPSITPRRAHADLPVTPTTGRSPSGPGEARRCRKAVGPNSLDP